MTPLNSAHRATAHRKAAPASRANAGGGLLAGVVIGAAVGGLAGVIWADHNNDGCVDDYVREGRYYEGSPVIQRIGNYSRTGERG